MAWTAPYTWVTGLVVTASLMNTYNRDNSRYLKGLDGAVTTEDDLTVDNLITSGNVDGVDVSAHAVATTGVHGAGGNTIIYSDHSANTTTAHGAVSTATASKVVVRDASARAKVAAPSAEDDIALKSNVTTVAGDLTTHTENTTTAHGAVSTATASKVVVRDASARAKFGAPGAAGDALIKGTRVTTAELPALTDEKIWKGSGGNPEELTIAQSRIVGRKAAGDVVALTGTEVRTLIGWTDEKLLKGAGAGVAPDEIDVPVATEIASGSYSGNDNQDRQITTGFKCSHIILFRDAPTSANCWVAIPNSTRTFTGTQDHSSELSIHASNGFLCGGPGSGYLGNESGETYKYWAISE